jgi:hypothetical protein
MRVIVSTICLLDRSTSPALPDADVGQRVGVAIAELGADHHVKNIVP